MRFFDFWIFFWSSFWAELDRENVKTFFFKNPFYDGQLPFFCSLFTTKKCLQNGIKPSLSLHTIRFMEIKITVLEMIRYILVDGAMVTVTGVDRTTKITTTTEESILVGRSNSLGYEATNSA